MGGIPLGRIAGFPVNANWSVLVILWLFTWLTQLRQVEPSNRSSTLVGEIAMPLSRAPTATPDEPVTALLERLASGDGNRALVVDGARVVGIVTPSDLTRLIDVYRLARPGVTVADGHRRGDEDDGARRIL
jgi:hypothetical protein